MQQKSAIKARTTATHLAKPPRSGRLKAGRSPQDKEVDLQPFQKVSFFLFPRPELKDCKSDQKCVILGNPLSPKHAKEPTKGRSKEPLKRSI